MESDLFPERSAKVIKAAKNNHCTVWVCVLLQGTVTWFIKQCLHKLSTQNTCMITSHSFTLCVISLMPTYLTSCCPCECNICCCGYGFQWVSSTKDNLNNVSIFIYLFICLFNIKVNFQFFIKIYLLLTTAHNNNITGITTSVPKLVISWSFCTKSCNRITGWADSSKLHVPLTVLWYLHSSSGYWIWSMDYLQQLWLSQAVP